MSESRSQGYFWAPLILFISWRTYGIVCDFTQQRIQIFQRKKLHVKWVILIPFVCQLFLFFLKSSVNLYITNAYIRICTIICEGVINSSWPNHECFDHLARFGEMDLGENVSTPLSYEWMQRHFCPRSM